MLGENGSGKTTLMNMLVRHLLPGRRARSSWTGKEVVIRSPKDAFALGIGMIHQHFKLVDVLYRSRKHRPGPAGNTAGSTCKKAATARFAIWRTIRL